MPGNTTKRYPAELKARAVRMVEQRPEDETEWAAMQRIAPLLGIGTAETLRKWVRRAQIDAGARDETTSSESEELRQLRREVAELKRANAILRAASTFFAAELDRPHG